jgi:hypothetical protein
MKGNNRPYAFFSNAVIVRILAPTAIFQRVSMQHARRSPLIGREE